jgi:uncharacterized membrane protein YphA (DoxX/SURF4 family)
VAVVADLWRSIFRIAVGAYWLYFASTKWTGLDWTRGVIQHAAAANPVPGLRQLLVEVVAPNWYAFSLAQTIGETLVAVLLIAGLATRAAAVLGSLLALGLAVLLSVAVFDVGFRWLYYLGILVNVEVVFTGPGRLALQHGRLVPAWLRW